MHTKGLLPSMGFFPHKFVSFRVSEHSFAKIIHPPDRCGRSRYDCRSALMHDYRTSVPWVGHNKSSHRLCIELIKLLIVALKNVGQLLFNDCANLLDTGRNGNKLSYTPIYSKQAQCVTCLVSMQATQELGRFQLLRIVYRSLQHGAVHIMLQHEVMAVDECHDNGPQGLIMVSLCVQIAINKMHPCVVYVCSNHNPTASMGHSVHNVDISKPLAHMSPYTPSARYSEHQDSSMKRTLLQSARHHWRWAFAHSSQLRRQTAVRWRPWWGQRARRWTSLKQFLTVSAEILWLCKPTAGSAVRLLVSDNLAGDEAGCGGPGLAWLHVVRGCEAYWMNCWVLGNNTGDCLW